MIYTVTLNPSVDYHVWMSHPPGPGKAPVLKTSYTAGGKGINVSLMLKTLGHDSMALGFWGGFTGTYLSNFLQEAHICADFITIEEASRINVKLHWPGGESEITGTAPAVSPKDTEKLLDKIMKAEKGDILVLSGSLPQGLDSDIYARILSLVQPKGVEVFVDAAGAVLSQIVDKKPFAIKPNHQELAELTGRPETKDIQENLASARLLFEKGIKNVIISLGEAGAILVNKEGAFHAQIPKGEVLNTVGAGDSLVAGFIAAHMKKDPSAPYALSLAAACGTATAFSGHLSRKDMIDSVFKDIKITDL